MLYVLHDINLVVWVLMGGLAGFATVLGLQSH